MEQNNKLLILIGISGSGKTSFATNYIKENSNVLRINRDSIRLTLVGDLNGYYQRKDLNEVENIVTDLEDSIFENLICNDSVIIDNTNLKQSYINKWIGLAQDNDIYQNIKFKLFDISLEEAKERVYDRENMYQWGELLDKNKVLGYIDKQFEQYKQIKQYLETNYKDQII